MALGLAWIRSLSSFGVLMPLLDFFWKQCRTAALFVPASRYYERDVAVTGRGDKGQEISRDA